MVSQNSEFTRKLRAAVRAKIEEFGIDVDDELPDYVMIMVGNKKDKSRMKADLKLFLGDKTSDFVDWLFGFFQKVKSATGATAHQQQQQQAAALDSPASTAGIGPKVISKEKKKVAEGAKVASSSKPSQKAMDKSAKTAKVKQNGRKEESSKSREHTSVESRSRDRSSRVVDKSQHNHHRDSASRSRSSSSSSPPSRQHKATTRKLSPITHQRRSPPPIARGRRDYSVSPNREPVVLASRAPALRSVVAVPASFPATAHPRITAIARTPSPAESRSPENSSPLATTMSPKVIISDDLVPVEQQQRQREIPMSKIVNQLDIGAVAASKVDEAEKPKKKQQIIRTIKTDTVKVEQQQQQPQNDEAVVAKPPRRRVIGGDGGGGSLIFQRAIQGQKVGGSPAKAALQQEAPLKERKAMIVRPQPRVMPPKSPTPPPTNRRQYKHNITAGGGGIGSIFQRAIQETRQQPAGGQQKQLKRVSAESQAETDEAYEEEGRKRIRMEPKVDEEMEEEKEEGEAEEEEQDEKEEEMEEEKEEDVEEEEKEEKGKENKVDEEEHEEEEEEEEEEVLTIDMSKEPKRKREIRRPPKVGFELELVKQHIGGGATAAKEQQNKKEEAAEKRQQQIEQVQLPKQHVEQGDKELVVEPVQQQIEKPRTIHLKRREHVWARATVSTTTAAPIWDGRIEIDDMSSTDDEAEIDAVLEDAQRLRKLALERELPPTAALSRPLLYNPSCAADPSELISPSDAALLPAAITLFPKHQMPAQLMGLLNAEQQQSAQQQQMGTSGVVASQQQQQRPHATVAPTTTIQSAPATMIVQQQYYYHQQQQSYATTHPYAAGYVPLRHRSNFRYPMYRAPMSKVYTAANSKQLAIHQSEKESAKLVLQTLAQLREQHKQKTAQLHKYLEEQRLLLGQLQKMGGANDAERRKELLLRVKQLDSPMEQLKREMGTLGEQMASVAKTANGN